MARKRLTRFFWLCLFFLLIYLGKRILFSSIFDIKIADIRIEGDIAKDEVERLWNGFLRQNYPHSLPNIFKLNTKALRRTILSDVRIDSVKIKRKLPSKLILFIKTREPFGFIKEDLGVDKKGIIFPIKGTHTLPHILGFKEKKNGDTIDVSFLFPILKIAEGYSFAPLIKEVSINDKSIFFSLDNILVCIPSKIEGVEKRFKRLENILKIDLSNIKLIDLRYEDVILSPSLPQSFFSEIHRLSSSYKANKS